MAEERTRGNRNSAKDGLETRRVRAPSLRSAADAVDQPDVDGERGGAVAPIEPSVSDRTIRAELASIVRESALEVLAPIARKATTQATKYAISKGPTLAKDAITPRLKDTLGPRIEEAGGAGALTKSALSAVSGKRGPLSRVRRGRGDDADGAGIADARQRPVHEWIDVAVPLESAFARFTRFEDFVEFVPEAVKVEQVDDAHLVWHLRLWGLTREWEIEITDREPNERIAWRSRGGTEAAGVVTFNGLTDRLTRIDVLLRVQPRGALATAASGLGIARRALRSDLTRFKAFVELGGEETDDERGPAGEPRGRSRGASAPKRGKRAGESKRGTRKPAPKRREARDQYETEDEVYESERAEAAEHYDAEADEDYEAEDYEAEDYEAEDYEAEDEEQDDYEPEEEEYEEEDEPSASEEEDEPDEVERKPATRGRGVRRRPPARPLSRSRGRS